MLREELLPYYLAYQSRTVLLAEPRAEDREMASRVRAGDVEGGEGASVRKLR